MNGKLTMEQYCDLFVKRIYDVANEKGTNANQSSKEIAQHFSIDSFQQTRNIFEILLSADLIRELCTLADGTILFHITGKGSHYVETGGKTGIIKSYLTNSNVYTDKSINIETNQGVANTGHINQVTQYLSVNDPKKVIEMLDQMKIALTNSQEDSEIKEEGLLTIGTIQNEMKKKNPLTSVIKDSLSTLAKIATILGLVETLRKIFGF